MSTRTPLPHNVPIVDENGNATPFFQRLMQDVLKEKAVTDGLAEAAVPGSRQVIAGTGLTGGGPLSANVTLQADPEFIRDTIASFIIAGSSVTVTHNDGANTLTISSTGGGGGGSGEFPFNPPSLTSWTAASTAATFSAVNYPKSGLAMNVTSSGAARHIRVVKDAPAGAFSFGARVVQIVPTASSEQGSGLIIRNKTNGRCLVFYQYSDNALNLQNWTTADAFSANVLSNTGPVGRRSSTTLGLGVDAGGTVTAYIGNGAQWQILGTTTIAAFLGAGDLEYGFFLFTQNTAGRIGKMLVPYHIDSPGVGVLNDADPV